MEVTKKKIEGLWEITQHQYEDERGFSSRVFDEREFKKFGFPTHWTEVTHQRSKKRNILRGLYAQPAPYGEGKLLRVMQGDLLWVSVDVRPGSKTFGQWDSAVLSGEKKNALYTERGFAHGCVSLTDDVDLLIMSDSFFVEEKGVGIKWDDPELAIDWQLNGATPFVSERHKQYPSFADFKKNYGQ